MTRIKRNGSLLVIALLSAAVAYLALADSVPAQTIGPRKPIALSVATTPNGNYLMYRMWSDGLIDVRLINPLKNNDLDWPDSDQPSISFQERWKIMQYGD